MSLSEKKEFKEKHAHVRRGTGDERILVGRKIAVGANNWQERQTVAEQYDA